MHAQAEISSAPEQPFTGLILRAKDPENLEFPFATLDSFITSNEQFFVRSHFPVPKVDAATWRLKLDGLVERPGELTLDELRGLKSRTVSATIECAGNNRIFLSPKVDGLQWELGAVGNPAPSRWCSRARTVANSPSRRRRGTSITRTASR